jgi:hypothetical protein
LVFVVVFFLKLGKAYPLGEPWQHNKREDNYTEHKIPPKKVT